MGFLGTYPPTACGIATFTKALREAIAEVRGSSSGLGVVSLEADRNMSQPPEVVYQHSASESGSLKQAIRTLNTMDVAVIQHEYGIFGGPDGIEVLDFVDSLDIPVVVTLHTVPRDPTAPQRFILERLVRDADRTVVLSQSALDQLRDRYEVDETKLVVIPHGADARLGTPASNVNSRPVMLSWGLIGPGKGLETAIEAMAALKDLRPLPRYIILGATHPKVYAAHGDAYLHGLMDRVTTLGLEDIVEFRNQYVDLETQIDAVRHADLIVIPYDSTEQVVSGVLIEAIAAGKPVVATSFLHAIEMLSNGAGLVVPPTDPALMAGAFRTVLCDPVRADHMAAVSRSMSEAVFWPTVATTYDELISSLNAEHAAAIDLTEPSHPRVNVPRVATAG